MHGQNHIKFQMCVKILSVYMEIIYEFAPRLFSSLVLDGKYIKY